MERLRQDVLRAGEVGEGARMKGRLIAFAAVVIVVGVSASLVAGIRGPGKYCGVVIFDRWGACTLYSGTYVMYISENVKAQLRPYEGQCVQIDAKQVDQPMNPGDGLISELEYLGPAPAQRGGPVVDGLSLSAIRAFQNGEGPRIKIVLRNEGDGSRDVSGREWAPTVLGKATATRRPLTAFDDACFAVVTRQAFVVGAKPRASGKGVEYSTRFAWSIDAEVPTTFTLKPGDERAVTISLELPKGEYEFLSGYGGGVHEGKCVASNLVAFDVDENGKATFASVPGRRSGD